MSETMSSYIAAMAMMVLVVSPLLIPIGVTVADVLGKLWTNHRVAKDEFSARDAGTMGCHAADAGRPIHA
ncbi:MAG: hypothetical protein ACXWZR_08155 [Mycobacterium sp.]